MNVLVRAGLGIVIGALSAASGLSQTAVPSPSPSSASADPRPTRFVLLFPREGPVGEGWTIRTWADVKDSPQHETVWEVRDGILYGGKSPTGRWVGTWLFS